MFLNGYFATDESIRYATECKRLASLSRGPKRSTTRQSGGYVKHLVSVFVMVYFASQPDQLMSLFVSLKAILP